MVPEPQTHSLLAIYPCEPRLQTALGSLVRNGGSPGSVRLIAHPPNTRPQPGEFFPGDAVACGGVPVRTLDIDSGRSDLGLSTPGLVECRRAVDTGRSVLIVHGTASQEGYLRALVECTFPESWTEFHPWNGPPPGAVGMHPMVVRRRRA